MDTMYAGVLVVVRVLLAALLVAGQERPWLRRPNSNNQYQFNDDENSWVYARERCRAQGADLVSINDREELVRAMLPPNVDA